MYDKTPDLWRAMPASASVAMTISSSHEERPKKWEGTEWLQRSTAIEKVTS